MTDKIKQAAELIKKSKYTTAFTGAGISVESGIPPFRGENGLWNKYDPQVLDLEFFYSNPMPAWQAIKEIFYDFFGNAKPNDAHLGLAKLEQLGLLKSVITQNIDNLHQEAGNTTIYEFHGNSKRLVCNDCDAQYVFEEKFLDKIPPECPECGYILKPDFIFFGESIPELAYSKSVEEANAADVFIIIGTTGEVVPAAYIPQMAKQSGASIIEINKNPSNYTDVTSDIYLEGNATEIMNELLNFITSKDD